VTVSVRIVFGGRVLGHTRRPDLVGKWMRSPAQHWSRVQGQKKIAVEWQEERQSMRSV